MTRHTATADAPLPLDEFAPLAEADQLRAALVDALTYLEQPGRPVPANRLRMWRRLGGRAEIPGEDLLTPEQRAADGIARAAAKWTEAEVALVDEAISRVANRAVTAYKFSLRDAAAEYAADDVELLELTTADVWAELDGAVPVTKGIAGRMTAAANAGIIANTGRTIIAPADAPGPNHGQRLTVWRALITVEAAHPDAIAYLERKLARRVGLRIP